MSSLYDRVMFKAASAPGTGSITVGSAVLDGNNGDRLTPALAGVPSGVTVSYVALDGNNWGKGRSVITNSGGTWTVARDSTEVTWNGSTVGNTPISLSSNAVVFFTALGADIPQSYFNGSSSNVVTNPAPTSATQVVFLTVLAASYQRVFAVSGMITWNTGTHGMRGNIFKDGGSVWPAVSNTQINPIATGDGAYGLTFSGIPITIAGDNASHTLGLAWAAQAATTSITLQEAWITAIQVG